MKLQLVTFTLLSLAFGAAVHADLKTVSYADKLKLDSSASDSPGLTKSYVCSVRIGEDWCAKKGRTKRDFAVYLETSSRRVPIPSGGRPSQLRLRSEDFVNLVSFSNAERSEAKILGRGFTVALDFSAKPESPTASIKTSVVLVDGQPEGQVFDATSAIPLNAPWIVQEMNFLVSAKRRIGKTSINLLVTCQLAP